MKICIAILIAVLLVPLSSWAATTIPFTITTSEAVNVTGTPRIAVDVGGVTRYATYTSGTGTSSLTFTYTMVSGDVDLDGVTLTSPMQLNGGTIKDLNGNDATLTFTVPNTSNVKVNYPSLGMDFVADADGRYTLNGTIYNDLTSFLSAAGGTFTRASIGTYYDSAGTLQTAASGTPRFDYDPVTHAAKGILIEESRTNLLLRSSEFENAAWTKANATVTANATTAPDGTMTADKLIGNSNTNLHYILQGNLALGTTYAISVYAKAAEETQFSLNLAYNSGGSNFDLSTGAITSTSFGTASITSVGNGWYRCTIVVTPLVATNAIIELRGFAVTYTGDGTSGIYVWGAQVEQGSFHTSYIPTVATTVTRQADNLTMPTGAWFNSLQGTAYTGADFIGTTPAVSGIFSLDDNTVNNRVDVRAGQGYAIISSGGVHTVLTPTSFTGGLFKKFNMAYSATVASATINGGSVLTSTPRVPVGISTLRIGDLAGCVGCVHSGHVQNFKYYPNVISNTQLQMMTQ